MKKHEDADDHVARDGESVRIRLDMMDSMQRAVTFDARNHQPHFGTPLNDGPQHDKAAARMQWIKQTCDAWRSPAQRYDATATVADAFTVSDADPQRQCRVAYDAYVERLGNAWRTVASPRDAERRHLEPDEPDADDAQARRDAAWASYRDRLGNAWRTDPRAATAIERQAERWRGGR